jgi:hypothetical protein
LVTVKVPPLPVVALKLRPGLLVATAAQETSAPPENVKLVLSPLPPATEIEIVLTSPELTVCGEVGVVTVTAVMAALAEMAVMPPRVSAAAAITATFFKYVLRDIIFLS